MDIKNLNLNVPSGRAESLKAQDKTGAQNNGSTVTNGPADDKVTLTGMLVQVRELEQKAEKVNVDNGDRIAALKASIQDGSYRINPERIAEKLIQSEVLFSNI
ncbi:MAG: flagellar biosynthesis anti-sigma factor FlgM [Gammaproteobacteria bacterium]|nr:flagellar biosynthesis anti-sigma factor FlgM [Gammaproteobacteria bacterium]MBD3775765.1 flagellar biosynthesis anti-sigma factor FlgM [Thiotrichales bacterium]